jgi:hypothetical protein
MTRTIRRLLFLEGASFILAGQVHFGALATGYQDAGAATAESVIGVVLLAGLALTWVLPARARAIGVATQGFALMGTLVGVYVAAIGVGPHTVPDVVFHIVILLVLSGGLVVAARVDRPGEPKRLTLLTVVRTMTRASGLVQLALGLAFWTGTLLVAVPFHIFNGLLFVLLLEIQAGLAASAGASRRLVAVAVAWGLFVPVLGVTQGELLPGDWHWLGQVAHLGVGLVAMGLAERLADAGRARLLGGARLTELRTEKSARSARVDQAA